MNCETEIKQTEEKIIAEFLANERCLFCGGFKEGTPAEKGLTTMCDKCFELS